MLYPEAHFMSYGMGWLLHDYKARKIVDHGGAVDGQRAQVGLIPEEKLGVVILTNMHGTTLPHALMFKVFDAYLGAPERDWSAELLKTTRTLEGAAKEAAKKLEAERAQGTRPTLALEKYAGTYQNDLYGEVKVAHEQGKLVLRFGSKFNSDLEHWHYDTFRAQWAGPTLLSAQVSFALNAQGKVAELKLDLPGVAEYPFKRIPDAAPAAAAVALTEQDLKKFTGKFSMEGAPIEVSIEMVGGKLKAMLPGQPVYTLIPVGPTRFQIEGAPAGFFVQYDLDGARAKSITIEQGPGQSLTLKPKA